MDNEIDPSCSLSLCCALCVSLFLSLCVSLSLSSSRPQHGYLTICALLKGSGNAREGTRRELEMDKYHYFGNAK